jgi:CPA1 family monovalent cation:H+ antiporter
MAEVVLTVTALLGLGFFTTRVASFSRVPHSVILVGVGILGVLALRLAHVSLPTNFWHAFPEVVLYILLPPLVFDSAYHLEAAALRRDLWSVGALSTVALLISCAVVAFGLRAWLGLPLEVTLLFGALISATDPVAVVALFKEVGAPRRLSTLIEGESLINDGTAIVLFRIVSSIAISAAVTTTGTNSPALVGGRSVWVSGALQFVVVVAGGVVVGMLIVVLASVLLRLTHESSSAQLGLTVATAYASFIVADRFVGVSGVISTMTVGLYLGNRARLELGQEALHSMHALWEFLALCANTLVFLAVGFAAEPDTWKGVAYLLPPVLCVVFAARALSVIITLAPLNALKLGERVSWAYQAVLIWGGLRGGLALALVLLLPEAFPHRSLLLSMALGVVLFTLLVNALSTAPLLRWLHLDRLSSTERSAYDGAVNSVFDRVFGKLAQSARLSSLSAELLADLQQKALARLSPTSTSTQGANSHDAAPFEIQSLLRAEQQIYDEQFEEGVLNRQAYLALQRLVNGRLQSQQAGGAEQVRAFPFEVRSHEPWLERWFLPRTPMRQQAMVFEVLLHLELAMRKAGVSIAEGSELGRIHRAWLQTSRQRLDEFFKSYPHLGLAVQSRFIASSFLASSRRVLADMVGSGLISEAVSVRALSLVNEVHLDLQRDAEKRLEPSLSELLAHVPLFRHLPPQARDLIEAHGIRQRYPAGTELFHEGDVGTSLYLVLSGVLEVRGSRFNEPERRPRLFAGASFGEVSLLSGTVRQATVAALGDSEVMEIRFGLFSDLLKIYPAFRAEVEAAAEQRRNRPLQTTNVELGPTPTSEEIRRLLGQVPLFAGFPEDLLEALAREGRIRQIAADETLFRSGDPATSLVIVLRGELELEATENGAPSSARIHAGQAVGELSLMFGAARNVTVISRSEAEVLEIERTTFDESTLHFPLYRARAQEAAQRLLVEQ